LYRGGKISGITDYVSPHTGQASSSRTAAYRNAFNLPAPGEVYYFSANKDTADFLCRRAHGFQFGYWRDIKLPTSAGWDPYGNLSIIGFNPMAAQSRTVVCSTGSSCRVNKFSYGDRLSCYNIDDLQTLGVTQH
jgi:hypothetical protein